MLSFCLLYISLLLLTHLCEHYLAKQFGAQFLDLNEPLRDELGELKAEYTIEGIHMHANGYKPILDQLWPLLEKLS